QHRPFIAVGRYPHAAVTVSRTVAIDDQCVFRPHDTDGLPTFHRISQSVVDGASRFTRARGVDGDFLRRAADERGTGGKTQTEGQGGKVFINRHGKSYRKKGIKYPSKLP